MDYSCFFKAGTAEGLEAAQAEMLLEDFLARRLQEQLPGHSIVCRVILEERDDPYTDSQASVTWRGKLYLEDRSIDSDLDRLVEMVDRETVLTGPGDIFWARLQSYSA